MSQDSPTARTGAGRYAQPPIDEVDRQILRLLGEDGRMPVATLAERVRVSRANAYTRLERLRQVGIIDGFSVRVVPERVGLGITAVILISVRQPAWRHFTAQLRQWPEVEYCAFITGEYDAMITVRVRDVETLRDVVLERLQGMEDVRSTQTIFVLDEVVRRPFILP